MRIAPAKELALANREVQIHPGELLHDSADDALRVVVIDMRPENEYNLFDIHDAQNSAGQLAAIIPEFHARQALNTIFVMSNDEEAATDAWRADG